jgi:predicted  nucleic acid-binding Zn-ribbon protein
MNRAALLFQLQNIEAEIGEKEGQIAKLNQMLDSNEALNALRTKVQSLKAHYEEDRITIRDLELNLKSLEEKLREAKNKLYGGHVRNPKELMSLEKEVQAMEGTRSRMEERLLELMEQLEKESEELKALESELTEKEKAWQQEKALAFKEKEELEKALEKLNREREALLATIPAEDLNIYRQLRSRKGPRVVVQLKGLICQGCGITTPTIVAQEARSGDKLVLCPSCGRILFTM